MTCRRAGFAEAIRTSFGGFGPTRGLIFVCYRFQMVPLVIFEDSNQFIVLGDNLIPHSLGETMNVRQFPLKSGWANCQGIPYYGELEIYMRK